MAQATQGAKWTGFFKFVTAQPHVTKMTDSQEMADVGAYNNYTWYQRLVQGSASRMTRYREYDLMDNDVEVARALDTIAEEITGNQLRTNEPLDVILLTTDEKKQKSSTVLTIRTAVRRWFKIMGLDSKMFPIVRMSVKYGDCFFRKGKTVWDKWQFIHPKNVIAAIVDEKDVTKIVAWQVKKDLMRPQGGGYGLPIGAKQDTQYETEIISSKEIIRFTLADDMSDSQPFGESILRPVYRTYKQKELLEDAILIYRIQRAPERRVFSIDVGGMNPARIKTYLEGIKNEMKQKRVPTMNGGQSEMDTVYNPHSMCLSLNTQIPLLDGRTLTLQEMIDEFQSGKKNWIYSIDPKTGEIVPGPVSWAGITRRNAETIKITFDDGSELICTPDHKIPVQGKGFVEAKDLTEKDSLYPFRTRKARINERIEQSRQYDQIYNPGTKGWRFTHRMVAKFMEHVGERREFVFGDDYRESKKTLIHHESFDANNNSPENLVWMNYKDHALYHQNLTANQEVILSGSLFERFEEIAKQNPFVKKSELLTVLNQDEIFMEIYQKDNDVQEKGKKYKIKTDQIRTKMFHKFMKTFGYKNWKDYQNKQVQKRISLTKSDSFVEHEDITLLQMVIDLVSNISIHNHALVKYLEEHNEVWNEFLKLYHSTIDKTRNLRVPTSRVLETVSRHFGYTNFKHLVRESANFNHKIVSIEKTDVQDTGTLTIDQEEKYHDYHTFATTTCFVRNSEDIFLAQRPNGRGNKVETLPGGQGLGELADLEYFQRKVWRGLRIPSSYMMDSTDNGGAIFNDGKVGVAYIQELRFALFISRLQLQLESSLDHEFKRFLNDAGIRIDEESYEIRLPEPSNFSKYRQLEVDTQVLGAYGSADAITHLSKRFAMRRFMQLSDEDIINNERMKAQELGLDPDEGEKNYPQIYGDMGEEMGGLGGGLGGDFMGGGAEAGMGGMEPGAEAGGAAGAAGGAGGQPPPGP